ncbi:hypothetical protein ACLMJK_002024 [Lecanora helva]
MSARQASPPRPMLYGAPTSSSPTGDTLNLLCQRQNLVEGVIQLALDHGVVVIRSPPATGKTTLLELIRQKVLSDPSRVIEPVRVKWHPRDKKEQRAQSWHTILDNCSQMERQLTQAEGRGLFDLTNSGLFFKELYLIDDAENSFIEMAMWDALLNFQHDFSNPSTQLYILACKSGIINGLFPSKNSWGFWGSTWVPASKRVDFWSVTMGGLQMALTTAEVREAFQRWILPLRIKIKDDEEFISFLMTETGGHVGMLLSLLNFFRLETEEAAKVRSILEFPDWQIPAWTLKPKDLKKIQRRIISFVGNLSGCWTKEYEAEVKDRIIPIARSHNDRLSYLNLEHIQETLNAVVDQGTFMLSDAILGTDVAFTLAFCNSIGILYAECNDMHVRNTTYKFPSLLHRRAAARCLDDSSHRKLELSATQGRPQPAQTQQALNPQSSNESSSILEADLMAALLLRTQVSTGAEISGTAQAPEPACNQPPIHRKRTLIELRDLQYGDPFPYQRLYHQQMMRAQSLDMGQPQGNASAPPNPTPPMKSDNQRANTWGTSPQQIAHSRSPAQATPNDERDFAPGVAHSPGPEDLENIHAPVIAHAYSAEHRPMQGNASFPVNAQAQESQSCARGEQAGTSHRPLAPIAPMHSTQRDPPGTHLNPPTSNADTRPPREHPERAEYAIR